MCIYSNKCIIVNTTTYILYKLCTIYTTQTHYYVYYTDVIYTIMYTHYTIHIIHTIHCIPVVRPGSWRGGTRASTCSGAGGSDLAWPIYTVIKYDV